uniref:Uncharacterized protein n=1 Tax=mine drainage metagenome TaxID=410659 RepID=E6PKE0_9ZZZZ
MWNPFPNLQANAASSLGPSLWVNEALEKSKAQNYIFLPDSLCLSRRKAIIFAEVASRGLPVRAVGLTQKRLWPGWNVFAWPQDADTINHTNLDFSTRRVTTQDLVLEIGRVSEISTKSPK